MRRDRQSRTGFTQNHGKPGVVYALGNKTLPKYLKIGQTRNLDRRLASLNADCNTSNPIRGFFVAYSQETDDCGRAELYAHQALAHCRVDAYREFFECNIETAKRVIDDACTRFRESQPKPPPAAIETPRQPSARDTQAEAARRYQAWLKTQPEKRTEKVMEAERERWLREREESLRTVELIRKINREAHERKAAEVAAVTVKALELNPSTFVLANPAPIVPVPTLAHVSALKIVLSVFGAIIGVGILSSVSMPAPSTPAAPQSNAELPPAAPDIVAVDLAAYAARYAYPQPTPADETILAQVRTEGRNLVFLYKSTDRGEKLMARQFDPDHIRRAMTKTACSKDDVRAFLARGVTVSYVLERSDGSKIIQHIACARPGQ